MRLRLSTVLAATIAGGCTGLTPIPAADERSALRSALPPLASAGPDREVLRAFPVSLDGSGSYHPAGRSFTVLWEQTSEPVVPLSNPRELRPMLVTPVAEGELTFRITVDDGERATSDSVTLFVRAAPAREAPRVRAAGDHYVSPGTTVTSDDLVEVIPDAAAVDVTPVVPALAPQLAPGEVEAGSFAIFRYEATADGLGSAPDYLTLWAQDSTAPEQSAPRAIASAPAAAAPGEALVLDGSASLGAPLRWRWQQLAGDPVLEDYAGSSVTVTAPLRPQDLVFRLHVAGERLESAPEEVIVSIAPEDGLLPPDPTPPLEVTTHAGNLLWVDALAGGSAPLDGVELEWQQTFGEHVSLEPLLPGRFVSLAVPAPAAVPDLALAVLARRAGVESSPAVTHITIIELAAETNQAPTAVLCSAAVLTGEPLAIYAAVADPEGDAVELRWSTSLGFEPTPTSIAPPAACERAWAPEPTWAVGTSKAQLAVELTAPAEAFSVTLEACDSIECGSATLSFPAS